MGKANPGAAPEELALEVPIAEEGFLYTYLSNGPSASSSLVYFDDFTVEQRSYIVAVHDYYPFGADFDQQSVVGVANKYRYQGKELQAELGLDLYDFHARQYDPLLGRMTSVDPLAASFDGMSPYAGMGNNPISYVDPGWTSHPSRLSFNWRGSAWGRGGVSLWQIAGLQWSADV